MTLQDYKEVWINNVDVIGLQKNINKCNVDDVIG